MKIKEDISISYLSLGNSSNHYKQIHYSLMMMIMMIINMKDKTTPTLQT